MTIGVTFFSNGNTMAFEGEQQVPELQESWIRLYAEMAEARGYDPTNFEFRLPNGRSARVFKTEAGFTWQISAA